MPKYPITDPKEIAALEDGPYRCLDGFSVLKVGPTFEWFGARSTSGSKEIAGRGGITDRLVPQSELDAVKGELAKVRDDLADAINWLSFVHPRCTFGAKEVRHLRQLEVFIAKHKAKEDNDA